MIARIIIAQAAGYLIGSVSPSYILGKLLKGIDIREHGSRNAGTNNTAQVLGVGAAIPTAIYDLGKGLAALFLARGLGLADHWAFLAAALAMVGHIFPFYLGFRGGQGVGTAMGLLLYFFIGYYVRDVIPWYTILVLAALAAVFRYIAVYKEVVGKAILPMLMFYLFYYRRPVDFETIFLSLLLVYITAIGLYNIVNFKIVDAGLFPERPAWWRLIIRPVTVFIPLLYLRFGREQVLSVVGIATLVAIAVEIFRLHTGGLGWKVLRGFHRLFLSDERNKFSSPTLFLAASFITIFLFPRPIALIALLNLIFGNLLGEFFGTQFGRQKFFAGTVEGSLAHLTGCLLAGYIFSLFHPVPVVMLIPGALAATFIEAIPSGVDDNLMVPLVSAVVMRIFALPWF